MERWNKTTQRIKQIRNKTNWENMTPKQQTDYIVHVLYDDSAFLAAAQICSVWKQTAWTDYTDFTEQTL